MRVIIEEHKMMKVVALTDISYLSHCSEHRLVLLKPQHTWDSIISACQFKLLAKCRPTVKLINFIIHYCSATETKS